MLDDIAFKQVSEFVWTSPICYQTIVSKIMINAFWIIADQFLATPTPKSWKCYITFSLRFKISSYFFNILSMDIK